MFYNICLLFDCQASCALMPWSHCVPFHAVSRRQNETAWNGVIRDRYQALTWLVPEQTPWNAMKRRWRGGFWNVQNLTAWNGVWRGASIDGVLTGRQRGANGIVGTLTGLTGHWRDWRGADQAETSSNVTFKHTFSTSIFSLSILFIDN